MATTHAVEAPRGRRPYRMGSAQFRGPSLLAFGVGVLARSLRCPDLRHRHRGWTGRSDAGGSLHVAGDQHDPQPDVGRPDRLAVGAAVAGAQCGVWPVRASCPSGGEFSVIAVAPAIFVAIFAAVTLKPRHRDVVLRTGADRARQCRERSAPVRHRAGDATFSWTLARSLTVSSTTDLVRSSQPQPCAPWLMMEKIAIMTTDRGLAGSFLIDSKGNELAKSAKLAYSVALKPSAGDIAGRPRRQDRGRWRPRHRHHPCADLFCRS